MTEALYSQNFRNIRIDYNGSRQLTVKLPNNLIRPISRAVGRAARTSLRLAPVDTREIRIVYADRADPVVTYDFFDLTRLERYFDGTIKKSELGNTNFNPFSRQDSFPSIHTTVAWAVATPFALEYDAPWLYGVAAVTNLARIGGRVHWVSDTVASSLIGYGLGRIFWESSRSRTRNSPLVMLTPTGIKVGWQLF